MKNLYCCLLGNMGPAKSPKVFEPPGAHTFCLILRAVIIRSLWESEAYILA